MVTVLQSHAPDPPAWVRQCLASVARWARDRGYRHVVEGDALFDRLDASLCDKTRDQPVVASDLARLAWMDTELANGAPAVLWLDADTLICDPSRFRLPTADHALGREVWVQHDARGRLRSYSKVHNAAMLFAPTNPWLRFYRHAAEHIVRTHADGPMVAQLVGPKLLTALHNLVPAAVNLCASSVRAGALTDRQMTDLIAVLLDRPDCLADPAAANGA